MNYFCCEEGRRSLVRTHPSLNGIDHLEVVHHEQPTIARQQRTLRVFFVSKVPSADPAVLAARAAFFDRLASLTAANIRIAGGERIRRIGVDSVKLHSAAHAELNPGDHGELAEGDHLEIRVTPRGDFSRYTLSLITPGSDQPLPGLDAVLSRVDFSFKVECASDFDCRPTCACPPAPVSVPELDYLARDYASFRQLMLDRLAVLAPDWRERNAADLGVTLVELLAYVGDYLSYRQDAIGTEAYLGTARNRVSVRRHTKLLDYAMHDGCNARTWVHVRLTPAAAGGVILSPGYLFNNRNELLPDGTNPLTVPPGGSKAPRGPRFVTRLDAGPVLTEGEFQRLARATPVEVFEPLERAVLFPEHNEMKFHTWGDEVCCLPKGATRATLVGHFPHLHPGQVLIFIERKGPRTGDAADADPTRRHVVRLLNPPVADKDPLFNPPLEITKIAWAEADALPFPLCISARAESDNRLLTEVSVAFGNIVLADHGKTVLEIEEQPDKGAFGLVPQPNPALAPVAANPCGHCDAPERLTTPPRFRPRLNQLPVTQAAAYDPAGPAVDAVDWEMDEVLPAVYLSDEQKRFWVPQRDLLSSDGFAREFVVEVEHDGQTSLRFGDDVNGMAPAAGTAFQAVYRVGNGAHGNVGAETLVNFVADYVRVPNGGEPLERSPVGLIESVTNSLPARGGVDPEPLEEARQTAPAAFHVQQRAVTPKDYAEKAGEHPEVQRAEATLHWTGSWHTIFLTVDRRGGRPVDPAFESELRAHLERYRLAGHDLEIDGPRYVPLELELRVCVAAEYFPNDVEAALRTVFDNRLHADGTRGFFHPDSFTFSQPVLLSRVYAAAQRVAGVRHVMVSMLRRQGATTGEAVPVSDLFRVGRLEIVRLDNDPNFPDRGVLRFHFQGGR